MEKIPTSEAKKIVGTDNYGTFIYHIRKAEIKKADPPDGAENSHRQYFWNVDDIMKIKGKAKNRKIKRK